MEEQEWGQQFKYTWLFWDERKNLTAKKSSIWLLKSNKAVLHTLLPSGNFIWIQLIEFKLDNEFYA